MPCSTSFLPAEILVSLDFLTEASSFGVLAFFGVNPRLKGRGLSWSESEPSSSEISVTGQRALVECLSGCKDRNPAHSHRVMSSAQEAYVEALMFGKLKSATSNAPVDTDCMFCERAVADNKSIESILEEEARGFSSPSRERKYSRLRGQRAAVGRKREVKSTACARIHGRYLQ